MKALSRHYIMAGLVTLAYMAGSCSNEDEASGGKTPVTLTFATRSATGAENAEILTGEGMKHLRVIVADSKNRICYNYTHTFDNEGTSTTVRFGDLYAGETYKFYAVANETSFDADFSNPDLNNLPATSLTEAQRPKLINNGLPAAGSMSLQLTEQTPDQTINLLRAVAKIKITFINETNAEESITNIKLSGASAGSTALFPTESVSSSGTTNLVWENCTVPASGSQACPVQYVYECTPPAGGYVLTATRGGQEHTFNLTQLAGLNEIKRNQQINISINLQQNNTCLLVGCTVEPWTNKELKPEFQ